MTNFQATKQKSVSSSVPALAGLWRSRVEAPFTFTKPLTPREFGQLKTLRNRLGDLTGQVMEWALNNWGSFAPQAAIEAGSGQWPIHPHIGFLLVHHTVALKLQTIATSTGAHPSQASTTTGKVIDSSLGAKKANQEKPFRLTPAQFARQMEALKPDGDLDKFWAEIELENQNKNAGV
jgi:hypothetical protein